MEIANSWADGEDAVNNTRRRSDDEDDRRFDHGRRGKRKYRGYEGNDDPEMIAASFPEKRGDDSRSSGYKGGSCDGNRDGVYRRPNR